MKKQLQEIHLDGLINMDISPDDPLLWKLSMLLEAANTKDKTIKEIANKYGYTREHFYVVLNKFKKEGTKGLLPGKQGPKRNYKRTKEVEKQVILHRFIDPEANSAVITQKMQQAGYKISKRSVERIIAEYNLQKKGYIKQIRKSNKQRLASSKPNGTTQK